MHFFALESQSKIVIDSTDDILEDISNSLGEAGILIAQLGTVNLHNNVPGELPNDFFKSLDEEDFDSVFFYAESHGRFKAPFHFLAAGKNITSRSFWTSSEAEIQLAIQKRTTKSTAQGSVFLFFDDATMKSYEFPSRALENKWCLDNQDDCAAEYRFDPNLDAYSESSFEVGISNVAKGGRGVFAKEFIGKGSMLGARECVQGMYVPPRTYALMDHSEMKLSYNEYIMCLVYGYVDGYGWYESELVRNVKNVLMEEASTSLTCFLDFFLGPSICWC